MTGYFSSFFRNRVRPSISPSFSTKSIDKGEIPKEWSLANICPLFKKGDRSIACNYRPVSLTCVPCNLLEHIVCSNIMAHLDEHRLLTENSMHSGNDIVTVVKLSLSR